MKLYRSFFVVPGNRTDLVAQATNCHADAVVFDLSGVTPGDEKIRARKNVREAIERLREKDLGVVVKVNGVGTGLCGEDIEAVVTKGLTAVAVPNLDTPDEVKKVDAWIELFETKAGLDNGAVEIIAIPETARGLQDAYDLASACGRIGTLVGPMSNSSGEVKKAIGYRPTRDEMENLYLASHVIMAARAAGIEYPIAGTLEKLGDLTLVREKLERARELGYRSAMIVDPAAVEIANQAFSPTTDEVEWNKGLLFAMAAAEKQGVAAVTYDGMMVDYAHVRNAQDLIRQAELFGMSVGDYPAVKAL